MRSSKNRSRSKGNRNRSVGNIVNRVFDSSGPEGKVRGTPQQIIDKYNQLTRDAQLGNDRVAAENFQQHAEHYLRMLSEAQREQEARREAQQAQQQQQQQKGDGGQKGGDQGHGQDGGQGGGQGGGRDRDRNRDRDRGDQNRGGGTAPEAAASDESGFNTVIDGDGAAASGPVDTPESTPKPNRNRTRRPRKSDGEAGGGAEGGESGNGGGDKPDAPPQEAAE